MQFRAKECEHSCLIALLNIIKDYSIAKMVELLFSSPSCEVVLTIVFIIAEALKGAIILDSALVDLLLVVSEGEVLGVGPSGLLLGDLTFVVLRVPCVLNFEVLELSGELALEVYPFTVVVAGGSGEVLLTVSGDEVGSAGDAEGSSDFGVVVDINSVVGSTEGGSLEVPPLGLEGVVSLGVVLAGEEEDTWGNLSEELDIFPFLGGGDPASSGDESVSLNTFSGLINLAEAESNAVHALDGFKDHVDLLLEVVRLVGEGRCELGVILHLLLKSFLKHGEEDLGVKLLWVHGEDVVPWESQVDNKRLQLFGGNLGSVFSLGVLVEVLGKGDHVVVRACLGALAATVLRLGVLAEVASKVGVLDAILSDNINGGLCKLSVDLQSLFRGDRHRCANHRFAFLLAEFDGRNCESKDGEHSSVHEGSHCR